MNTHRPFAKPALDRRILIVDDDAFMLSFLADLLRDMGAADITTASDGELGCKALDRAFAPPDLMLCDINMPTVDGFQLLQKLAERGYKGGVILLSGTDSRTMKSAALMASFHRLHFLASLSKPVDRTQLTEALLKLQ